MNHRIRSEDALGTLWQGVYDKAGRLTGETDGNGITTAFTYDGNGNKLTTTRDGILTETLQYDPAGNVLFRTDARGMKEGFDYDDRNLVISHNRPLASITSYKRDAMGDVIEERDPEGRLAVTTYDARRRALNVTVNGNETTTNAYDLNGNRIRVTQPLGNTITTVYNADNQPESLSTETGAATLGYDANGLLTSRTDPLGFTKTYVLDARSRRVQVIQSDGTLETHGFDNADRLLETTDANGVIISYQYDIRGRELRRGYSASADGLTAIESEWDGNGNLLSQTIADGEGSRTQHTQYDSFNRPEIVTDAYGNQLTHSYDANGNLTATTAPAVGGTGVTRYQYDVLNRLTQLQTGAELIGYQYDRSGRVVQTTYPGGLTTVQSWDGAGRLAGRSHQRNGTVLQSFTYLYDANGNRLEENLTQEGHNRVTTYQYDADDRLLAVSDSDGKSETYVLDANGNRIQIERSGHPRDNGVTTHAYDARGQVTTTQTPTGSRNYVWDANGNLTEKRQDGKVHAYTWNALNQLMKAERDSATVSTYRYGPAGLRDQVNIGAAQTRTVWDNGFAFLTQDQSGRTLTRTEHTGDKALYLNGESGKEILLRDGLDSVTGTVAPGSGTLQSKTDYDAWGNSVRTGATQSKHGYTGHLDDTETGLIYARARYYDSEMGRFINRDPLEGVLDSPVTWNAYLYANANPSKFTDPSGMSGSEFDWLSVGADFAGTTMMPAEMGAGRDPQMWLEPLFNDWGKGSLTESIDYAAEGCEGFLGCYSLAFMKTFYHASTWGFASHHDTVLSAYNKRLIDQQTYRTHGIGGGALIVTYNVALARLGGMKAFAGKGGGFKSAAGFGGAMGYGSDAISQWFLMDAGIQENFNYNQNAISGFLGMTGGGISHGLGKGFGNLTNGRQKSSELKVDEGNTSINHELDITLEKPAYSTSTLVSKGNTVISSVGNANIPSVQQLSKAAASANRNGLTDAGRSLQKHSGRPNSVYSSTDKKSTTLNREAQSIVDDILNDPKTQFNTRTVMEDKQKITVIEATASDGRVLRFNDNGTRFIGFREPTP